MRDAIRRLFATILLGSDDGPSLEGCLLADAVIGGLFAIAGGAAAAFAQRDSFTPVGIAQLLAGLLLAVSGGVGRLDSRYRDASLRVHGAVFLVLPWTYALFSAHVLLGPSEFGRFGHAPGVLALSSGYGAWLLGRARSTPSLFIQRVAFSIGAVLDVGVIALMMRGFGVHG